MENTIGKRIAAHRKRLDMTQEQLAEKLGITAQAVSKWENNQSCPDITAIPLLADIFGISTDALLGHEPEAKTDHAGIIDSVNAPQKASEDSQHHDKVKYSFRVKSLSVIGTAVFLIVIGILFLLSRLLTWDCSFWDILWPAALLVFGIFGTVARFSAVGLVSACFGAFFLVYNLVPLPFSFGNEIPWFAVCCIVCGLLLLLTILGKRRKKHYYTGNKEHANTYEISGSLLHCANSFGEHRQLVTAEQLSGGSVSNSFGEYTVDLSGVKAITENCQLEVSCSFGELKIFVPKRFKVVHHSSTAFAGFAVDGKPNEVPEGDIQIDATVNFGEISIQYI